MEHIDQPPYQSKKRYKTTDETFTTPKQKAQHEKDIDRQDKRAIQRMVADQEKFARAARPHNNMGIGPEDLEDEFRKTRSAEEKVNERLSSDLEKAKSKVTPLNEKAMLEFDEDQAQQKIGIMQEKYEEARPASAMDSRTYERSKKDDPSLSRKSRRQSFMGKLLAPLSRSSSTESLGGSRKRIKKKKTRKNKKKKTRKIKKKKTRRKKSKKLRK